MSDPHSENETDLRHHVTNKVVYFTIFILLMGLTALTTGIAFVNLGIFNTPVALGIAVCKASLVILYFMHVRWSPRLTWVVILTAFSFLGVMFVMTFADYLSRGWAWPATGPWVQ
ncbi:MAG: cytochrome C oxidase subunit IV family protein [Acidobacteriota bacterium]